MSNIFLSFTTFKQQDNFFIDRSGYLKYKHILKPFKMKFYHLYTSRLTCFTTFFSSYLTHYRIELPENIPVGTPLVSLTCTDEDGTVPNNNITYHLILDNFANETFTLVNNELKVSIFRLLSDL